MSNSLAIAAVSATLLNLLEKGVTALAALSDTKVTTLAPDRARGSITSNQLNLFLYQVNVNAAWRNMDMPRQVQPGETAQPPLALTLHYLITSFGRGEDEVFGHRVLGRAMSILHDHPVLGPEEIRNSLAGSDLADQLERVRITPQPLSVEEMSKLWSTFQTNYRLSAGYQVSVVLIESSLPVRAPLPVLTRVVAAQPDLTPPFPTLMEALPPVVRAGDTLTFRGHHLDGDNVSFQFTNPNLTDSARKPALAPRTATEVRVVIPDDAVKWPAGFYTAAAIVERGGQETLTNELAFALAPRIGSIVPPNPARDGNGDVTLTVSCSPEVRPNQRAAFLLGDREVPAQPHAAPAGTLTFVIRKALAGQYYIRLRVDGVDSILIDRSVTPPVFDASQRITFT